MRKQGYKPIPKLAKKPDEIEAGANESEDEEVPEAAGAAGAKDTGELIFSWLSMPL